MERRHGGIHAPDQPQVVPVEVDGRLVRSVTAGQKAWRGEVGREETTPKREGGDSSYSNTMNIATSLVYTVLAFFLFVSLRVGSTNTGRPYSDNL